MKYDFSQELIDELADLIGESCGLHGISSSAMTIFYAWLIANRSE